MQPRPRRPTGVTILGVLAILGGLAGLAGGALLIGVSFLIGTLATTASINNQLAASGYPGLVGVVTAAQLATLLLAFGVVLLVLGILYLITGIGFFGGKGWAWTLGIVVSVIGLIFGIIQIAVGSYGSLFGVIIDVLIIYYLTRPHVKSFFGKGSPTPMTPATSAPGQM